MTAMAERRVLAAVVKRAGGDVCRGTPGRMRDALDYFEGPNLDVDCDWLGLDPGAVRERVKAKEIMRMSKMKIFTEEQVLELHGESLLKDYMDVELWVCPWCGRIAFFMREKDRKDRYRAECGGRTDEELSALLESPDVDAQLRSQDVAPLMESPDVSALL